MRRRRCAFVDRRLRGDDLSGTALDDSEVLALRWIRWDKNMRISWGYIVYIYIYVYSVYIYCIIYNIYYIVYIMESRRGGWGGRV